jgi:hypothetical protein
MAAASMREDGYDDCRDDAGEGTKESEEGDRTPRPEDDAEPVPARLA